METYLTGFVLSFSHFSALDNESEAIVQEALDKLMADKSRTIVVIAHRVSMLMAAMGLPVFASVEKRNSRYLSPVFIPIALHYSKCGSYCVH
jgi:ABC-type nitrate/sulfonate/bicarbonate transport system ATPase subunit